MLDNGDDKIKKFDPRPQHIDVSSLAGRNCQTSSVPSTMFISCGARSPCSLRPRFRQDFRTAVGSLRLAVRMDKSALKLRQRLAEVLLSQARSRRAIPL